MNRIYETIFTLYEDSCEQIECDFILSDNHNNFKSKIIIKKGNYNLKFYGGMSDFVLSGKKSKVIINTLDIPIYYECKLINFPKEYRRKDCMGDIEITFPKVKVLCDFTISMFNDNYNFNAEIQPLYDSDSKIIARITIE